MGQGPTWWERFVAQCCRLRTGSVGIVLRLLAIVAVTAWGLGYWLYILPQGKELEAIRSENSRLRDDLDKSKQENDRQGETIKKMQADLKGRDEEVSLLEKAIQGLKTEKVELEHRLVELQEQLEKGSMPLSVQHAPSVVPSWDMWADPTIQNFISGLHDVAWAIRDDWQWDANSARRHGSNILLLVGDIERDIEMAVATYGQAIPTEVLAILRDNAERAKREVVAPLLTVRGDGVVLEVFRKGIISSIQEIYDALTAALPDGAAVH